MKLLLAVVIINLMVNLSSAYPKYLKRQEKNKDFDEDRYFGDYPDPDTDDNDHNDDNDNDDYNRHLANFENAYNELYNEDDEGKVAKIKRSI
mgnify:CR=1 FL=1